VARYDDNWYVRLVTIGRRGRRLAMPIAVAIAFAVADVRRAAAAGVDAAPPDIVRTKDGGVLRGTIIESVPNERIEILLPNGQSRTVMMAAVEFAGPAHGDPQAPAAPAVWRTPALETVRLELKADQPGVTFHRHVGTSQGYGPRSGYVVLDNFEPLCTAPCTAHLPAGTYRLGLSTSDDNSVLPAPKQLALNGKVTLDGRIASNAGIRVAGWVVTLASLVGGLILANQSDKRCDGTYSCVTTYPNRGAGATVGAMGMAVGVMLSMQPDRADISASSR
jgi:hypothetical protein